MDLTPQDALALRMSSLLLGEPAERPTDVAGVVTWFGAMQAQDLEQRAVVAGGATAAPDRG